MIKKSNEKELLNFTDKKTYYYNYSIDLNYKILIYKNKILLHKYDHVSKKFSQCFYSDDKIITNRWKIINNYILRRKGNPNFKYYYSVKSK